MKTTKPVQVNVEPNNPRGTDRVPAGCLLSPFLKLKGFLERYYFPMASVPSYSICRAASRLLHKEILPQERPALGKEEKEAGLL